MVDVTLDRKKALAFLSSFGENVEDLLVMVAGARLTGTIAYMRELSPIVIRMKPVDYHT